MHLIRLRATDIRIPAKIGPGYRTAGGEIIFHLFDIGRSHIFPIFPTYLRDAPADRISAKMIIQRVGLILDKDRSSINSGQKNLKQATKERVTKVPEERKQELIETAERLFLEKGYEQTTVSDIVRGIEVAQGTFYYYFSSKEEILEAIIEKDITALEENVRQIMSGEDRNAAIKLNAVINSIIGISASRREIMDYLHEKSNAVMHEKMERHTIERLTPLVTRVVAEGTRAGIFDVQYPTETSEFLLATLVYFFHHPEIFKDPMRREKMQSSLETILDRTLAVKDYRFVLAV